MLHGFRAEGSGAKCPRVWQGYKAIKRAQGPTVRKHPVTPEVCGWLDTEQAGLGLRGIIKRVNRYFGIYLGCRAGEYIGPDFVVSHPPHPGQGRAELTSIPTSYVILPFLGLAAKTAAHKARQKKLSPAATAY